MENVPFSRFNGKSMIYSYNSRFAFRVSLVAALGAPWRRHAWRYRDFFQRNTKPSKIKSEETRLPPRDIKILLGTRPYALAKSDFCVHMRYHSRNDRSFSRSRFPLRERGSEQFYVLPSLSFSLSLSLSLLSIKRRSLHREFTLRWRASCIYLSVSRIYRRPVQLRGFTHTHTYTHTRVYSSLLSLTSLLSLYLSLSLFLFWWVYGTSLVRASTCVRECSDHLQSLISDRIMEIYSEIYKCNGPATTIVAIVRQ